MKLIRVRLFFAVLLIMLMCCINAYGDSEFMPYLDGERDFNQRVEEIIKGEEELSPPGILNGIKESFFREIRAGLKETIGLIAVAAMSGLVMLLSDNGMKAGGEAAFFCCFAVMSTAALNCFNTALTYGRDAIEALTAFVTKLSPLLMTMLIVCGKPASAAVFHPVLSSAVYIVGLAVENVMLPMCVFCAVLSAAGNLGGENKISLICRGLGSVNKWIMSAVITVFTGISAIYGFNAPSLDALSAKTIKFAAGSLVPVVGGFLSDTLETVVSGSQVMKNAVGTAGMISICSICLIPVIKIGVLHIILRMAAALSEPLTDKRITAMLNDCAYAVSGVFALVVMSAVLFIIDLAIILTATNFI